MLLTAAPLLGIVPMAEAGALAAPAGAGRPPRRAAAPAAPRPPGDPAGGGPRGKKAQHKPRPLTKRHPRKRQERPRPGVQVKAEASDLSKILGDKVHGPGAQGHATSKAHVKRGPATAVRRPAVRDALLVSVSGPVRSVVPGGTYNWPFAVTAKGQARPAAATFRVRLPRALEFVSGQPRCAARRRVVVCRLGVLRPGQTVAGVITARVSRRARADQVIRARGVVVWGRVRVSRDFPPVRVARTADIAMTIAAPAATKAGEAIPYETRLRNLGPSAARNVVVQTGGPARLVDRDGACAPQGAGYACAVGELPPGARRTLRTQVLPGADTAPGAVLESPVRVTASTADLNPANNEAVARTRIDGAADGGAAGRPGAAGGTASLPVAYMGDGSADDGSAGGSGPRHRSAGGGSPLGWSDTGTIVEIAIGIVGAAFVLTRLGRARRRRGRV